MKKLAYCVVAAVGLLVLAGCTSPDGKSRSTESAGAVANIPLPATTPFDSNPGARALYLDWFRDGYVAGMRGQFEHRWFTGQPDQRIKEMGWNAGNTAAQQQQNDTRK